MRIIDLTFPVGATGEKTPEHETYIVKLPIKGDTYDGVCHRFQWHSMTGTYLDFPGHIAEFDDGADAANYPLDRLFMVDTTFIRLDREGRAREITAAELDETGIQVRGGALFIHARGETPWHESPGDIPYYDPSAIEWIISKDIHLFLSDVYEKHPDQQGIFVELFRHRISCVCCMVGLDQIRQERVKVCAIPIAAPGVKQVPCRLLVVEE